MAKIGLLSIEYVADARRLGGAWLQLILFAVFGLFFALLLMLMTVPALATGPHGPFDATTEKCEKCHAMHTANTITLLNKHSAMDLCKSCHTAGIGADTAVMQGALMKPVAPDSADYVITGTLLGGGFEAIGGATGTTSKHNIGESAAPFGGNNMGALIDLTCLSCHTPHEGPNYRLLRRFVGGGPDLSVTWNGPAVSGDGAADFMYEERDLSPAAGTQYLTYNYRAGMSAWCSACHTRYMTRSDADAYNAGDDAGARRRYRHAIDVPVMGRYNIYNPATVYDLPTDLPLQDVSGNGRTDDDSILCLTCHKAHGANSMMGAGIGSQSGSRGSLPNDSMLLRMDDRQVCQIACHKVVD